MNLLKPFIEYTAILDNIMICIYHYFLNFILPGSEFLQEEKNITMHSNGMKKDGWKKDNMQISSYRF